jgi:hypothetical protein
MKEHTHNLKIIQKELLIPSNKSDNINNYRGGNDLEINSGLADHYSKYTDCLKEITEERIDLNIAVKTTLKEIVSSNKIPTIQNKDKAENISNCFNYLSKEEKSGTIDFSTELYNNLSKWDIDKVIPKEIKEIFAYIKRAFSEYLTTGDISYINQLKIAADVSECISALTTEITKEI